MEVSSCDRFALNGIADCVVGHQPRAGFKVLKKSAPWIEADGSKFI